MSVAPDVTTSLPQSQHEPGGVSPRELADLLRAFNDVTSRLEGAHERLRAEVLRLESELKDANARLERSSRLAAIGEMAAGVAHEVRNPLASIGLYARMLAEDLADRPGQREIAQKIGQAVRGLDGIVGDVLQLSRELRPRHRWSDAGDLLERSLETARGDRRQRVRAWVDGGAHGVRLWCDPDLLGRAVVNIARNALEAMEETGTVGGELELGARVESRGQGGLGGPVATLWARDTGPGIPPEARDRVFNPFYTTRAQGTGLGLAIVHRIMEAHGGAVVVGDGSGGRGALVECVLPAGEQVEQAGSVRVVTMGAGAAREVG